MTGKPVVVSGNPVLWCMGDPTMSGDPVNRSDLIIVRKDVKAALDNDGVFGPHDVQYIKIGLQAEHPGAAWKNPAEVHWNWFALWPLHIINAALPRFDASEEPVLKHDLVKDLEIFTIPEWSFGITAVSERVVNVFKKFKSKIIFQPVRFDADGHKPWFPDA